MEISLSYNNLFICFGEAETRSNQVLQCLAEVSFSGCQDKRCKKCQLHAKMQVTQHGYPPGCKENFL